MKAVNSPWHDPLSSELCCSPGPYTLKAFCSPQALEPRRFPQRRPLSSHLAARGYLSQALIFSVDLSCLVLYPQVFFRGHAKNQRLLKPSTHFSHKNLCWNWIVSLRHQSEWAGGALGTLGGYVGQDKVQGGMVWSLMGSLSPSPRGPWMWHHPASPRSLVSLCAHPRDEDEAQAMARGGLVLPASTEL